MDLSIKLNIKTQEIIDDFYKNVGKKQCTKCKEIKSIEEFYKDNRAKDGHMCWCRECNNKQGKKWQKNNLGKFTKYSMKYYKNNLEKCREYNRNYHRNNPEKINELMRKWLSKPRNKLNVNISRLINYSLKKNKDGKHWEGLVNYTLQNLMTHLENQFTKDMSWENYGKYGWWIDHIIPVSLWNFDSYNDREFKQCWALCNLQPLWAKENISKGNRI